MRSLSPGDSNVYVTCAAVNPRISFQSLSFMMPSLWPHSVTQDHVGVKTLICKELHSRYHSRIMIPTKIGFRVYVTPT